MIQFMIVQYFLSNFQIFAFLQPADGLCMVQRLPGCSIDVSEGNWRYCSGTKPSLRSLSFLAFNQEVSV